MEELERFAVLKSYAKTIDLLAKWDIQLAYELSYWIIQYGIYGKEPPTDSSPFMLASFEQIKKPIDKCRNKSWNAKKNWEIVWNQNEIKTKSNENQTERKEKIKIKIKNKEIEDNKLSSKKKEKIPSVNELVQAYENNELLKSKIKNTDIVKQRAEYKQAKKDRAYKTVNGFIQRLVWIVKTVENGTPRTDTWERFWFALSVSMEKEWKDIYRNNQMENEYLGIKKFNSIQREKEKPPATQQNLHIDTRASWMKEAFPLNK